MLNLCLTLTLIFLPNTVSGQFYDLFIVEIENATENFNFEFAETAAGPYSEVPDSIFTMEYASDSSSMTIKLVWYFECFRLTFHDGVSRKVTFTNSRRELRASSNITAFRNYIRVCMEKPRDVPPYIFRPEPCPQAVYPNPTNGFLYVDCEGGWEIRDYLGRVLAVNVEIPNLTQYPNGTYYLRWENTRFTIIKQ